MKIDIGLESEHKRKPVERMAYVQDFGDNYHRFDNEPSSELERAARRIRRRYRRITDYIYAKAIYNEYMEYMYMKHGGKDLFKILLEDDAINDFVPAKPRLRNNANLRRLAKNKIITSNVNVTKYNKDGVAEFSDLYASNRDEALIDENDEASKDELKIIKKINFGATAKVSSASMDPFAYLEEYFQGKNKLVDQKREEETSNLSLEDIITGNYTFVEDTEEEDSAVYFNGQFMRREVADELNLYNQLNSIGWDHIKVMKVKGVSNKITKIARKQEKRNKKKGKNKRQKRKDQDDFLMQTIFDNDLSFGDYQKEMENMTFENIFK